MNLCPFFFFLQRYSILKYWNVSAFFLMCIICSCVVDLMHFEAHQIDEGLEVEGAVCYFLVEIICILNLLIFFMCCHLVLDILFFFPLTILSHHYQWLVKCLSCILQSNFDCFPNLTVEQRWYSWVLILLKGKIFEKYHLHFIFILSLEVYDNSWIWF